MSDAQAAADKGVVIVTTASLAEKQRDDPGQFERTQNAQKANLLRLLNAGAIIAAGSDEFEADTRREIAYLRDFGVFTAVELLNMWTMNCAQTIFPDRRIGRLADHYEASFVVIDGDPLDDFAATERIYYRFKDGQPLGN